MMRRILAGTAVLMAITVVSKFIGFARELILLERVGIGLDLDVFLVLLGIANVVTGALGICIVTSVTPLARQFAGTRGARRLMAEGLATGTWTWLAATATCLVYLALDAGPRVADAWLLAITVPGIVPFALLAEYQVGLFLARGQRTPVIAGNIIISLPLALALLAFDMGIVAYAVGLVASFALRAAVFALLLVRGPDDGRARAGDPPRVSLFGERLGRTLAGGSAMLAISLVYVTATMAARHFDEGQATLLGYGLKIPLFALTSAWFVLGTGFFADLVAHGGVAARARIARLSAINLALFAVTVAGVLAVRALGPQVAAQLAGGSSAILMVVGQSLPFLPLILFVPLVEMVQRVAVTEERHFLVPAMTAAVLLAGAATQLGGLAADSELTVFLSPAIAAAAGAVSAMLVLRRLRPGEATVEAPGASFRQANEDPFLP